MKDMQRASLDKCYSTFALGFIRSPCVLVMCTTAVSPTLDLKLLSGDSYDAHALNDVRHLLVHLRCHV